MDLMNRRAVLLAGAAALTAPEPTIAEFGGWKEALRIHFAGEGVFDQIYKGG